jgi:translation elongation factor aEF-1 beta
MGTVLIIVKMMPESPSSNLEEIKAAAKISLEKEGAQSLSFEEKPVAFGLKSIHAKFAFPEEKGTDIVETLLSKVKEVSSVTIEDYRRAFG